MANQVKGRVLEIGKLESIQTKGGATFEKRELVLDSSRYDAITGEKGYDNYVVIEFSQKKLEKLNGLQVGDVVNVSFELTGNRYQTQQGEVKYSTRARGYDLEVLRKAQQAQPAPQATQEFAPAPIGGDIPF